MPSGVDGDAEALRLRIGNAVEREEHLPMLGVERVFDASHGGVRVVDDEGHRCLGGVLLYLIDVDAGR